MDALRRSQRVIAETTGRGQACIFKKEMNTWVLRHFQRGGLVARWLHDQYIGFSVKRSRSWREWRLLAELWNKGLPVPRPVAASTRRHGLFYRADLITEYLPHTTTLAAQLEQQPLDDRVWRDIGQCIKRFHQRGVYHADLNAKNILLGEQNNVYLIDFDRGEIRKPGHWSQQNLQRLQRSLHKFKSKSSGFYFSETDWHNLLESYNS